MRPCAERVVARLIEEMDLQDRVVLGQPQFCRIWRRIMHYWGACTYLVDSRSLRYSGFEHYRR